jgi:hypothetical protein
LPEDAPGLIMVDIGSMAGAHRAWEPLVRRRLQPAINTRVGGVGLFTFGMIAATTGLEAAPLSTFIVNPHAKRALPPWIDATLTSAGIRYEQLMKPQAISAGTRSH